MLNNDGVVDVHLRWCLTKALDVTAVATKYDCKLAVSLGTLDRVLVTLETVDAELTNVITELRLGCAELEDWYALS